MLLFLLLCKENTRRRHGEEDTSQNQAQSQNPLKLKNRRIGLQQKTARHSNWLRLAKKMYGPTIPQLRCQLTAFVEVQLPAKPVHHVVVVVAAVAFELVLDSAS